MSRCEALAHRRTGLPAHRLTALTSALRACSGVRVQHVEVQRHFRQPLERVWARYTDHASWGEWAGLGPVRLAQLGTPPPNGVGCVREFSAGGTRTQEQVLTYDPPHRFTYTVLRGPVPMRDHLGEVIFEPRDGGTLVTWRCRFQSRLPGLGGLLRLLITRLFRNALHGLERDLG